MRRVGKYLFKPTFPQKTPLFPNRGVLYPDEQHICRILGDYQPTVILKPLSYRLGHGARQTPPVAVWDGLQKAEGAK